MPSTSLLGRGFIVSDNGNYKHQFYSIICISIYQQEEVGRVSDQSVIQSVLYSGLQFCALHSPPIYLNCNLLQIQIDLFSFVCVEQYFSECMYTVVKKEVVLPSYQYRNHCYCLGENQLASWNIGTFTSYCDRIFVKVIRYFLISCYI